MQPNYKHELGPDKYFDPKYTNWGMVIFLVSLTFLVALAIGCTLGIAVNPDTRLTCMVFIIIQFIIVYKAKRTWMDYVIGYDMMLERNRKSESDLIVQRIKFETHQMKMTQAHASMQAIPKLPKQPKQEYTFTSEDFDEAACHMLETPVRAARKAGMKVTGHGLVKTFLENIK